MQILEACRERCAMALGNFDGLHLAHQQIIKECVDYATKNGIKSGVLLFDRHTSELFGTGIKLLTTMDEKLGILESLGVDFVYIMKFDYETAALAGDEFISGILSRFSVDAFFAGYDYTFGKGANWKAEALKELGNQYGFSCHITDCVKKDGEVVSSSRIRSLLEQGKTEEASELLGRRYFVSGKVEKGFGNGRKSLYPTANVAVDEKKFLPPDGVYAGIAEVLGNRYRTAVNIGKNPTFDAKKRTVEAYLIDFDGDVYGEEIKVEFVKMLRQDRKFDSVEDLKEQIKRDIDAAKNIRI